MDLGLVPDSSVVAVLDSPSGGLRAFSIRGTLIAIRNEDSSSIQIYY